MIKESPPLPQRGSRQDAGEAGNQQGKPGKP
jgi:hypothetical protein